MQGPYFRARWIQRPSGDLSRLVNSRICGNTGYSNIAPACATAHLLTVNSVECAITSAHRTYGIFIFARLLHILTTSSETHTNSNRRLKRTTKLSDRFLAGPRSGQQAAPRTLLSTVYACDLMSFTCIERPERPLPTRLSPRPPWRPTIREHCSSPNVTLTAVTCSTTKVVQYSPPEPIV